MPEPLKPGKVGNEIKGVGRIVRIEINPVSPGVGTG
jgi:hypothetical protein